MTTETEIPIGVIADDFTGALDAGVEFVRAGLATILWLQANQQPAAVQVLNTDSRDRDQASAVARAANAAGRLAGHRLFKKIDSTMRGYIGRELETILDIADVPKTVVCPAVIDAGRIVRDGQLWVHGVLLHESHFAHDPRWPARSSRVDELIATASTHLPLATVRSGSANLAQAIAATPTRVITVDACTEADLTAICAAVVAGCWLPCGALGLARAWARQLAVATAPVFPVLPSMPSRPVLVVAGSRHPHTRAQVEQLIASRVITPVVVAVDRERTAELSAQIVALLSAGQSIVLYPDRTELRESSQQRKLVEMLGTLTARACQAVALAGLVLTGGETASAVCQMVDAAAVNIGGEVNVGMPWGTIVGGTAAGLLVVTKAGGFGQPDALMKALDLLHT